MDYDNQFQDINFQKYWLILKRGKLITLGVFSAVVSLGLLYALLSKPLYKSEAKLLVKTSTTSSLTGVGGDTGKIGTLTEQSDPLNAQLEILLSNTALKKTIEGLQLKDNQGELLSIEKLKSSINVEASKGTDFLKVNYTGDDPEMVAAVVKKLVQIYIEENIRENRSEVASARKSILKQLPQSEKTVKQAELVLRQFKEANNITSFTEESSANINVIGDLKEKINDVRGQLVDVTARLDNLTRQTNLGADEAATIARLSQVPEIQKTLEELQNAESQLANEQARFNSQNPTVINLTEKAADLKQLLQQKIQQRTGGNQNINWSNLQIGDDQESQVRDIVEAEKERIGLEQRLAEMNGTLSRYEQESKTWPQLEQEIRELERKVTTSQSTYETLLVRLQEINVAENQNIGNIRIISHPLVPEEPFNSRKKMIVLASGVLGILLGMGVTLIVDMTDGSLKTVDEAKELLPYNLLTVIPDMSQNGLEDFAETELSTVRLNGGNVSGYPVADAYQLLQANLNFCSEEQPKVITITSSVSNEGKSKICANLALAMAQGERRVLLIDGNMRCPTQHEVWGLDNSMGLINMVLNHVPVDNVMVNKVPFDAVVQNIMPNLDVLPSGGTIGNTFALLESNIMDALVQKLRVAYDFIIFDAPSLEGNADAVLMGKLSDGIVFVVRPGVTSLQDVDGAKELLRNSRQKVLGMVINEQKVDSGITMLAGRQKTQNYLNSAEKELDSEKNQLGNGKKQLDNGKNHLNSHS